MYEVRLNADPGDFLDWDLPLSEQPRIIGSDDIQTILNRVKAEGRSPTPQEKLRVNILSRIESGENLSGKSLYSNLTSKQANAVRDMPGNRLQNIMDSPNPSAMASDKLREAGIPGVRFLDQGSRAPRNNRFQVGGGRQPMAFSTREAAERHVAEFGGELMDSGAGTYNYSVFNDAIIEIVKKYGLAAVPPGLIAAAQSGGNLLTQPISDR